MGEPPKLSALAAVGAAELVHEVDQLQLLRLTPGVAHVVEQEQIGASEECPYLPPFS